MWNEVNIFRKEGQDKLHTTNSHVNQKHRNLRRAATLALCGAHGKAVRAPTELRE